MPSSESIYDTIARVVDPEAWKLPLKSENTFVVRRTRSLQKATKMITVFRTAPVLDKLVEAINAR